jgi:hypothetical protein
MNTKHALFVSILISMLLHMPAKAESERSNSQAKITPNFESPSLKVGEPFLSARAKILRSGWHPIPMHANENYEYWGTERVLNDQKFVEVDFCSVDAGSLCVLYYMKGTKCLRLGTVGEQLKYMKVTRWTEECPEKNEQASER